MLCGSFHSSKARSQGFLRVSHNHLLRRAVLPPTVNFPYRRLGDRFLPDAVVAGPTALKVEIDLHGILAEGGRRARQAQRQSGN